jgi:hypothetical protein
MVITDNPTPEEESVGTDKPTTRVLLVVDRSGSMAKHADVVRSGINEYVQALRADKGVRYRVTVALFSDGWELLCKGVKPKEVPVFTEDVYWADGMTALHYAIGRTIDDHELTSDGYGPDDKVILVVQTDGAENYSHQYQDDASPANAPRAMYDSDKIKAMIAEREERGWTCVYLGAGPAAWSGGREFRNRVETHSTRSGHANTYSGLSGFTKSVSRGMHTNTAVDELAREANKDEDPR